MVARPLPPAPRRSGAPAAVGVDATTGLRAQLEQRVLARLLETEAAVGQRVLADGRAATAAVDAEIAAVDAEIRRVAAQRSGRLASCERDHAC